MANNTTIYKVFNVLVDAIKENTEETNIYLMNRPDIADNSKSFVVVDLPMVLDRNLIGGGDHFITTRGLITLFVKSRTDGTPNIDSMTSKLQAIMDIFPLNSDVCVCTDPAEALGGKDKYGYQFMIVKFKIRTI